MCVRHTGHVVLASAMLVVSSVVAAQPVVKARYGSFGVNVAARNTTVKPGDDFWTFAHGACDKNASIAAGRTSAGVG